MKIYIYIYIYTHLGVKLIWLNFKDPIVPRHGKTGRVGWVWVGSIGLRVKLVTC